ncbi:hypothetical protein BEWA_022250 [Theileria equi strain WA]|uniref:Uncharacterized protein n=1 Tax=Theileria equi strain WA TaxID=1537102 RepID=L0AUU5_THEEQ|nr:hypothetical protein BEWA_022250 [Theileria equi strain WA]AFZ79377.1 hypothetical protein BEWA_022250 [Theileria equi strain WA]|eukprot:XP_004829043.1 hypothetical protein BEWA_022250 [Theileria equi strain WA]
MPYASGNVTFGHDAEDGNTYDFSSDGYLPKDQQEFPFFENYGIASAPEKVCNPQIGLSTKEANERIIEILEAVISKYEHRLSKIDALLECFKTDTLLAITSFLLLCFSLVYHAWVFCRNNSFNAHRAIHNNMDGIWQYCLEASFLLPWITLNAYIKVMIRRTKSNRTNERVKEILELYKEQIYLPIHAEFEQKNFTLDPPCSSLVPVYRDFEWVRLPTNVIVTGDVFKLQVGDVFPCDCKRIRFDQGTLEIMDTVFKCGSTCDSVSSEASKSDENRLNESSMVHIDGTFIAQSDACITQLESFLDAKKRSQYKRTRGNGSRMDNVKSTEPDSPMVSGERVSCNPNESNRQAKRKSVWNLDDTTHILDRKITVRSLICYFTVSLLTAVLHVLWRSGKFQTLAIVIARLFICLVFPGFEPIINLCDIWGNVKLQSLFHWYQDQRYKDEINPEQSVSSSSLVSGSSVDSVDTEMAADQIPLSNQLKELSTVFKRGLDGEGSLIKTLSSVTLLCFVDDIGILTEGYASPQEICIVKDPSIEKPSVEGGAGFDSISRTDNFYKGEEGLQTFRGSNDTVSYEKNRFNSLDTSKSSIESSKYKLDPTFPTECPVDHRAHGKVSFDKKYEFERNNSKFSFKDEGYDDKEDLVILDVFSDPGDFGKHYIRLTNSFERSCMPKLRPLTFAMALTQFPRYKALSNLRTPTELLYAYLGRLANSDFTNFTDCQCTLAGSVGLRRSFIRRFRLLRFIVLHDESYGDDGKILLFFFRDFRKQIVQMIVKCDINVILDKHVNFHCNKEIVPVTPNLSRKLKDLSMQWVSSGMSPLAYAYKPIHVEEFNLLMTLVPFVSVYNIRNFDSTRKGAESKRYKTYLRMREDDALGMYYEKSLRLKNLHDNEEVVEDAEHDGNYRRRVLSRYVGEMVTSCIKNSILLGVTASKREFPKEVPNRIKDFHDAGIRFVYFSKHGEKKTRIFGSLLGLETSWNSMISLSASDKTFINQEGRMVLPNGIENIRQHIEEVDDIPLQVSLFYNCTPSNTAEMLNILRDSGETIMCIGGGLTPSNFNLFKEANCSICVALGYHPVCRFCKGKRWEGVAKAHIFDDPVPEFRLSAALTSLPCALQTWQVFRVADPYFVMEMLFEVFKEARHMAMNMQEGGAFIRLAYHALVWMMFVEAALEKPNNGSTTHGYTTGGRTIQVTKSEEPSGSDFYRYTHQDKESGGQEPFNLEKILNDTSSPIPGIPPKGSDDKVTSVSAYYWKYENNGGLPKKLLLIGVTTDMLGTKYYGNRKSDGGNKWIGLGQNSKPELINDDIERTLDDLVCSNCDAVTIDLSKGTSMGGDKPYCCRCKHHSNGSDQRKISVTKGEIRVNGSKSADYYKHEIKNGDKVAKIRYYLDGEGLQKTNDPKKRRRIKIPRLGFPTSRIQAVSAFYCGGNPVLIYVDSGKGHAATGWYHKSTNSNDNGNENWTEVKDLSGVTPETITECNKYNKLAKELSCASEVICLKPPPPTPKEPGHSGSTEASQPGASNASATAGSLDGVQSRGGSGTATIPSPPTITNSESTTTPAAGGVQGPGNDANPSGCDPGIKDPSALVTHCKGKEMSAVLGLQAEVTDETGGKGDATHAGGSQSSEDDDGKNGEIGDSGKGEKGEEGSTGDDQDGPRPTQKDGESAPIVATTTVAATGTTALAGYVSSGVFAGADGGLSFVLSAILYKDKLLPGIIPYPIPVQTVFTYRTYEGKILLIRLQGKGTQTYYFNPDTNEDVEKVIFSKFVVSNTPFDKNDVYEILQNISENSGLDLVKLNQRKNHIAIELLGENDIIFDLTHKPPKHTYISEITNIQLTISSYRDIGGFIKIQHIPTSYTQFRVLGIRLKGSDYMKVKGGFPNYLITEFYVYYGNSDHNHIYPLLIDLKVVPGAIDSSGYIPSRYYITKNTLEGKWDIRKVGSVIDEKTELGQILQNIATNEKLNIVLMGENIKNKLYDIRNGLPIDLTQTTAGDIGYTGTYISDEVYIPYKKETSYNAYSYSIRHAYNIPRFPIKSINTSEGTISGKQLPLLNTMFWKINVYCKSNSYNDPVLIELIGLYNNNRDATESPMCAYYYCKEGSKWMGYILSTTVGESGKDMENVIKHIKQNYGKVNLEDSGTLEDLKSKLTRYPPVDTGLETEDIKDTDSDGVKEESGEGGTPQKTDQQTSGPSAGAIAGYTTTGGVVAAETVNFALDTGWSVFRRTIDFALIAFVYIPIISIALLANPITDRIMHYMPSKSGEDDNNKVKTYTRTYPRLCLVTTITALVFCIYLYYIETHIRKSLNLSLESCNSFLTAPRLSCVCETSAMIRGAYNAKYHPNTSLILSQTLTSVFMLIFFIISSSSWIDKYSMFDIETLKHYKWMISCFVILTIQIANVSLRIALAGISVDSELLKLICKVSASLLAFLLPIVLFDHCIKYLVQRDKNSEQKFLELLFSTRLGTWSPK